VPAQRDQPADSGAPAAAGGLAGTAAGVLADRVAAALVHREPGWRLPRRSALARRYNVSVPEIDAAIGELIRRSLIRRLPDGQLYRASQAEYLIPVEGIGGLSTRLDPMGGEISCQSQHVSQRDAPQDIAWALGTGGEMPVRIVRCTWATAGVPVAVSTAYVPEAVVAALPAGEASLHQALQSLPAGLVATGSAYAAAVDLELSPPQPSVARSLKLVPGQSAISVTIRFDGVGSKSPVGLAVIILKPEHFRVVIEARLRPNRAAAAAAERIPSAAMDTTSPARPRLPIRARLATTVGGAAATVSRLAGRGDGSVIGGIIGLRLEPELLSLLAAGRQVVLVTGTNGKTTTTRLITAALGATGEQIASNIYGANMEAGLTSALSRNPGARLAVLETDEKYIPAMIKATRPKVVVLLNLSRDQMDRAAEIWMLARRWRDALAASPGTLVVANADDPLVAWAASGASEVTWVAAGQRWREDSWCCPNCGAHLERKGDEWACHECPNRRPPVRWTLRDGQVVDPEGHVQPLGLALPGRANASNAVVALAVAEAFGVSVGAALGGMRGVTSVAGRYTTVQRHGTEIRLLLAKNPAGWLEALDVMEPEVPVLLAVNAQTPDGKDTSWLWDVDYRRLQGRPVLVGGERRLDLAVRLEADEVEFELVGNIDQAVTLARSPRLEVLANYTAFQQYRAALGRAQ
jgi:UDP-N-acetylmuramyl tripeptide synthase/DNA-binding GntR family transcriptional regulator